QLLDRKVGGRAAAKINKVGLAPADDGLRGVNRKLPNGRVDVAPNRGRIFVCVNLEITKVAALAAKRDVQINAKRRLRGGGPFQSRQQLASALRFPERKRRIVRDKIIANGRLLLQRRRWKACRGGGDAHGQ